MARSIMDVMQENINPVSVSNALYELMVDWRGAAMMTEIALTNSADKKWRSKRSTLEIVLSRFFGVTHQEMRELLEEHFDISIKEKQR